MSQLPEPGTPLRLADGRTVDPRTGRVVRPDTFVAVTNNEQTKAALVSARKKLTDLPDTPERMNVISAVAAYQLCGLDMDEIAVALGISIEQVTRITELDAYTSFTQDIVDGIQQREGDRVRSIITSASVSAAQRVTELIQSDDDGVALAAAKDALDRDGHRPVDVVEHRHRMEGGLTIRYVDDIGDSALDGVVIEGDIVDAGD